MEQFFNTIANNNGGNGGGGNGGQMNFPMPNQNNMQGASRSASIGSRSGSIIQNGNNMNLNVLAGMLNQRGMQQQPQMNMNMGQMGQMQGQQQQNQQMQQQMQQQQQMNNFMNQNGGFMPQMMNPNRRQSDASILSQTSSAVNNQHPSKTLLNMLDDGNDFNQNQNNNNNNMNNNQGPSPQDQDNPANVLSNINFNDAPQQQQSQLLLAMQQRMQQQRNMNAPQPQQNQNQMQMPQPQQNQQRQMSQNQGQMQQNQMQALAQMQQNLAQLQSQESPTPQLLEQRQNQISEFLSRHGHNLSDDQRSNLRNQICGLGLFDPNMLALASGGGGGNMGGPQMGLDMAMMQQILGNAPGAGGAPVPSMNDLMTRQREQLRNLQVMLKPGDEPDGMGEVEGGGVPVQGNVNQGGAGGAGGGGMNNFSMQPQRQSQSNNQMQQGQGQGPEGDFFRGSGGQQQQQQPLQVQSQQKQLPPMQQLQQMQQQQQQQKAQSNQPQQRVSSAVMEHMNRHRQNPGQGIFQRKRSQESLPTAQNTKNSKVLQSNQSQPSPPISQDQASLPAASNSTRVVPVALSPRYLPGVQGDISEAALIYTKHALNSIVRSLNLSSSKGRVYTIRDLSTCLGAWDLSHPSNSGAKRQKPDESNANVNDGNAETAFNFYYERSCPILLDAQTPTGAIPFSVEDFGEGGSSDTNLPALTGAVVLTFGADKKFTGGIGEEGVLTKAIFEFFYEPAVALGKDSDVKDPELSALVEAEEQLFARVENEESSFVKAALHALWPSLAGDDEKFIDKKVYVPTIWSGNTNRVYQYCLLGNFDDEGKELSSKRLCVAIQKKPPSACADGPSKGVCRITVTLSPTSVLAEKKRMANERDGQNLNEASSKIHRKIRQNLRCLRPPKLVSPSSVKDSNMMGPGRRRVNLRRPSMTHLIDPSLIVVGMRCKHELLLDADEIGKVYINGSLVADCSLPPTDDKMSTKANKLSALNTLSSNVLPAHTLFGIDFTFPNHNEAMFFRDLPDKVMLEHEYGALLVDALIDATQFDSDVAGKLLCRLVSGKTEDTDEDEQEEEEKGKKDPTHSRSSSKSSFYDDEIDSAPSSTISFDNTSNHCIESIVLSSSSADPVGIGAKALSTKFRMHYGKDHFPCEVGTDEEYRLKKILGHKKIPQIVPRRVREILSRGGYLPLAKMATFIWQGSGAHWDGDHDDSMRASEAMEGAIQLLKDAGCNDVKPNMIRFVGRKQLEIADVSVSTLRCWYDAPTGTYFVNDSVLFVEANGQVGLDENNDSPTQAQNLNSEEEHVNNSHSTNKESYDGDDNISSNNLEQDSASYKTSEDKMTEKEGSETKMDVNDDNGKCTEEKDEATTCDDDESKDASKASNQNDDAEDKDHTSAASDVSKCASKGSNQNDDAEDKDHTSASSDQTNKMANSCKEIEEEEEEKDTINAKPSYRPTKEVGYLLALHIARAHPDTALLENFVLCHSS